MKYVCKEDAKCFEPTVESDLIWAGCRWFFDGCCQNPEENNMDCDGLDYIDSY